MSPMVKNSFQWMGPILTTVVGGVILYYLTSNNDMLTQNREMLITLKVNMEYIDKELIEIEKRLQERTANRYTKEDAKEDLQRIEERIKQLSAQVHGAHQ